jgi:mannose-6-phosphate isomerase
MKTRGALGPEALVGPTIQAAIASFRDRPSILPLQGAVQHYEWGGYDSIPRLIGVENAERRPFAELWIGAHPKAPSLVEIDGASLSLAQLIARAPEEVLGGATAKRFAGELPFLLKVLDARSPLSIQAHPSKRQAIEGFARENAAGIPLEAPQRNYQDANHKPEIHVALGDFRMLHGFRTLEEIDETLASVPELGAVMPDFSERLASAGWDPEARRSVLRELYGWIMTMPQQRVDALLDPLIARLERRGSLDKDLPDYWALAASRAYPLPGGHRDRGIFSIYLLNLVRLRPGEGTFQPAGTLHAYLEGVTVECMANSDNVLRGGLTPKHVDARELLATLGFDTGRPEILGGREASATERVYDAPADEFQLSRIDVGPGRAHRGVSQGPEALIVIEGTAQARWAGAERALPRGGIILVPAGITYTIESAQASGPAVLFKASVPITR